jgi:phytoene dehydrogenase-like protein
MVIAREAFETVFDLPDFPMIALLMTVSFMHNRNADYPSGGSQECAQAIERRYLDLGGGLPYHSPVRRILVGHNQACGVQLASGEEYRADYIISVADGRTTIFQMLAGKYIDDDI